MATYYKPQSPIQSGEDFIYPITTADQVKVDKDTRLNAVGVYLKNIDNSTDTTVYGNNATTLGGVAAEDYALKTDTAPDSSKLGGKAPEYYLQPRNLLDNSDFRNPVNQRGATSYAGDFIYTIDRWQSGDGTTTLKVQDDGIKVYSGSGTLVPYIFQRIEKLRAGTYTFTAKYHGNTSTVAISNYACDQGVISVPSSIEENGILVLTFTTTENWDPSRAYFRLQGATNDNSVVWEWAALYEGEYTVDTLPPYVPKGYAAELAECDLYYRPLGDNVMSVIGMTSSDGGVALFKSIRPMMDGSVPTVINNGTLYVRVNGVDYTATNVRILKSDKSGVEMLADVSGAPSKQAATIHGSALLALSRDL